MASDDADKLAALEAAVEAELERRIQERFASGEIKPTILGVPRDAEARDKNPLAVTIVTGVPRCGRDVPGEPFGSWPVERPADNERYSAHRGSEPRKPITRPEPAELVWRPVRTSIPPRTDNDPGAVLTGTFVVDEYNRLRVRDSDGRDLGSEMRSEADDVEAAARRILRAAKRSSFWAPVQYPRVYH
jgi:hypothetical protein